MAARADDSAGQDAPSELPFIPPAPAIKNFPIPRELRDEIYAYLLDAERVEEVAETCPIDDLESTVSAINGIKYEGPRRTYKFSTGIMSANKTIGAEAQAFFCNHNRFVRVHFDVLGFQMLRAMMDLPVIAVLNGKHMQQHCLSIRIAWPKAPNTAGRVAKMLAPADNDKGVIVISLKALPKVCDILRFLGAMELPSVPVVTSGRGEKLSVFCPGSDLEKRPGALRITLAAQNHSLQVKFLQEAEQSFVLDCFQDIHGGGYDFSISGVGDLPRALETKTKIAPALIFPAAFLLDHFAVLRKAKRQVDLLAAAGHYAPASARYSALALWQSHCWEDLQEELICVRRGGQQALVWPAMGAHWFKVELGLAAMALSVVHRASEKTSILRAVLNMSPYPLAPRAASVFQHLCIVADIDDLQTSRPSMATQLNTVIEMVVKLEGVPVTDDWITHDLGLLQDFIRTVRECQSSPASQAPTMPSCKGLRPDLSLWTMPGRVYDSTTDPDIPPLARSEDYVGWEDRAHMAELTKEDECAVHGWQKSMGLPLSTFG